MRRSAKVFGFLVVAALLAAACGGDDSSTIDTAAPDTAIADSATSDTTADGDRDRNVQVGTWGTDGSGFAELVVNDRPRTGIDTRVFRRSRIEVVNGRKLINTRDVFVASVVNRETNTTSETFFKVAGYDTTGDDLTLYTMRGFGEKGVATVRIPERTNGWASVPSGWTIISRDILAVFFDNWSDSPEDAGGIEYYDLRTGGLVTTLGDGGRTVIPRNFPISWVRDIGLRAVDDDGTIHLLLAGLANYGEENESVMVAGITPDGRLDPKVGVNGSGTIDYADVMAPPETRRVRRIRIADPGIEAAAGALGLAVVAEDLTSEQGEGPSEDVITYIVSRAASPTTPITNEGRQSFAKQQFLGQSNVEVRNIALGPDGEIRIHLTGTEVGKYPWDATATNSFAEATSSEATVMPANGVNWAGVGTDVYRADAPVLDVSTDGRKFAVEGFNNQIDGRFEERVCFGPPDCQSPGSFATIELSKAEPLEGASSIPQSVTVGASGVHVAIENVNYDTDSRLYTVANFDSTGAVVGGLVGPLDKTFSSQTYATETTSSGPRQVVVASVSGPIALDANRVVALRSSRTGTSLVMQEKDKEPREVKLSLPFGIRWYSTAPSQFTAIDANHVSMVATIDNSMTRVRQIYKMNVDNGSVDTTFGKNGYVEVSSAPPRDACVSSNYVSSAAGAIASVTIDWPANEDGEPGCAREPSRVRWTTFAADGKQIGATESAADPTKVDGWTIAGHAIDARGNLFYAKYYSEGDDNGDLVDDGVRIAKFGPSGELDTTFGKAGLLQLSDYSGVKMGTDAEGRLYVTSLVNGEILRVSRFSTAGVLDAAVTVASTTTQAPAASPEATPHKQEEKLEKLQELESSRAREEEKSKENAVSAVELPNNGITVTTDKPVLTSVKAEEDRSLTVAWALSASVGTVYVTATANPGGRSCTSDTGSCVIRGLDPTETYTITLAKKGDEPQAATIATATRPIVSLKVGRVASPTTFVRPASKGKATWKVRGGCKLNESNTRVTAPKSPTTCQLSVTTAKFGSTPKTTKSVTIVVKK